MRQLARASGTRTSWDCTYSVVLSVSSPSISIASTLSFIDTVGPARFVAECKRLARLYGERFKPTKGLLARAQTGELYYDTAAKAAARAS